jgi:thioredoxin:protein disulfide reductase
MSYRSRNSGRGPPTPAHPSAAARRGACLLSGAPGERAEVNLRLVAWLLSAAPVLALAGPPTDTIRPRSQVQQPEASSSAESEPTVLQKLLHDGGTSHALLPADEAFRVSLSVEDATTLLAELTPARDYALYRDRIEFRVQSPPDIEIANVELPRGEMKDDPGFGKVEVFRRQVQALLTLKRRDRRGGELVVRATYQGCNELVGVCYPAVVKTYRLNLPASAGNTGVR